MNRQFIFYLALSILLAFIVIEPLSARESIPEEQNKIHTRYTTITYSDLKALRKFNKTLYMGNLAYLLKGKKNETIQDEVKNKIPTRWMYPIIEYNRNEEHVKEAVERQFGGQDTPNEMMWIIK